MLVRGVSLLFTILAIGCTSTAAGPTATAPTASPPTSSVAPIVAAVSPTATPASATTAVSPSSAAAETVQPADGPPAARLSAEGGDPVTGQLGTYVWRDQGSDSPWLPGARIAVGRAEPLTIRLAPRTLVASWQARIVPADLPGPDGAVPVGKGSGIPRFQAPKRGAWTLEVHIVFADDAGDASYFWRLDVR